MADLAPELLNRLAFLRKRAIAADPTADPRLSLVIDGDGDGGLSLLDAKRTNRRLTVIVRRGEIFDAITRMHQQIDAADARRRESAAVAGFERVRA